MARRPLFAILLIGVAAYMGAWALLQSVPTQTHDATASREPRVRSTRVSEYSSPADSDLGTLDTLTSRDPVPAHAFLHEEAQATILLKVLTSTGLQPLPGVSLTIVPRNALLNSLLNSIPAGTCSSHNPTPIPAPIPQHFLAAALGGQQTTTDSHGCATISVPALQPLLAMALPRPNLSGPGSIEIEGLLPSEVRTVTLSLATSWDLLLEGRVVDAETACGVQSQISFFDLSGYPSSPPLARLTTDRDGTFASQLPSWGPVLLVTQADTAYFVTRSQVIGSSDRIPIHTTVFLRRAANMHVRLENRRHVPIGDLTVRAACNPGDLLTRDLFHLMDSVTHVWDSHTSIDGTCTFSGLPATVPLSLTLVTDDHTSPRRLTVLDLLPGEHRELTCVVGSGGTISGRVMDTANDPCGSQLIWLVHSTVDIPSFLSPTETPTLTIDTASDGRFQFTDVPPGTWWVGPAPHDLAIDRPNVAALAPVAEVVRIFGDEEVAVAIVGHRGKYVSGSVVDPDGGSSDHAIVMAHTVGVFGSARTITDAEGHFSIGPLPLGPFDIRAVPSSSSPFGPSEIVPAYAGDENIKVILGYGLVVEGIVITDHHDTPQGQVFVSLVPVDNSVAFARRGFPTTAGQFRFKGVPSGRYYIVASTSLGDAAIRQLDLLRAEDTANLALSVTAGGRMIIERRGCLDRMLFTIGFPGIALWRGELLNGRSEAQIVPPGEYVIEVWSERAVPLSRTVAIGAGDVQEVAFD